MEIQELLKQELDVVRDKIKVLSSEMEVKRKELKLLGSEFRRKELAMYKFLGQKPKSKKEKKQKEEIKTNV